MERLEKMKMLNIACGGRYHHDWINIDFHADSNMVKKVNILGGLPFEDSSIDVVYSSHFLEHLSLKQTAFVLSEAKRVLKDNGIIRIVVPNTENICKEYLKILSDVQSDKSQGEKYNWIVVELFDQLVRVNSGGEMGKIFKNISKTKNEDLASYILYRTGDEPLAIDDKITGRKITLDKIKNKLLYFYLKIVRLLIPINLRDLIFVNTSIGERHQWMYDKYSMGKMLENAGFGNIKIESFDTSSIDTFNGYLLDVKNNGSPYKGVSSLYIEANR